MVVEADTPEPRPARTDVVPESYAIHVTADRVSVWQYRVTLSDRDGTRQFVETLDRSIGPKLALDHATTMPPEPEGY